MSAQAQTRNENWWKSPEAAAEYRHRRGQQRAFYNRKAREEAADAADYSAAERKRDALESRRVAGSYSNESWRRRCESLPKSNDLQALADTFGTDPKRLTQALELQRRGLGVKAKRLILCLRIGRRIKEGRCPHAPTLARYYRCHGRYCEWCGPAWFRRKFSDLLLAVEPLVEHLLHEGRKRGRPMVIAKLDFTVPNTGRMPTPAFVRQFHRDIHRFWRAAERRFGISPQVSADEKQRRREIRLAIKNPSTSPQVKAVLRAELRGLIQGAHCYGWAGCDEFGGGNSNLHRHCLYVGPALPQRKKELSNLWSEIRGERSFVSIKRARGLQAALAHALKYPAKFLSASTPERLAELEATFHRTRRFATGGAFYRLRVMREPGEDSDIGFCPICGAPIEEVLEPWVSRFVLEAEGRRDVEEVRREAGRQKVFSGSEPPL